MTTKTTGDLRLHVLEVISSLAVHRSDALRIAWLSKLPKQGTRNLVWGHRHQGVEKTVMRRDSTPPLIHNKFTDQSRLAEYASARSDTGECGYLAGIKKVYGRIQTACRSCETHPHTGSHPESTLPKGTICFCRQPVQTALIIRAYTFTIVLLYADLKSVQPFWLHFYRLQLYVLPKCYFTLEHKPQKISRVNLNAKLLLLLQIGNVSKFARRPILWL